MKNNRKHMKCFVKFFGKAFIFIKHCLYMIFIEKIRVAMLSSHGNHVRILEGGSLSYDNIICGSNVTIGKNNVFLSSRAKIIINDHVIFGPNVTIVTGDHRLDLTGRTMDSIKNEEKLPDNDQNVIFYGDNWIGANATILKGVKVGYGAVIGAGSVVTKNVSEYEIVVGSPAKSIGNRMTKYKTFK